MEHKFIKNRDIVLFSFQPWDIEIGSNFKDMAMELAKHNRVLFIDRAIDRVSLWKNHSKAPLSTRLGLVKKPKGEIRKIQPSLWILQPASILESINGIPVARVHDQLNRVNNKRLANEINAAITSLGLSNVILINDNDFIRGRYLKQLVNCSSYIFYIRDFMTGVGFFKKHGPRLESGILREADMVVANSAYLATYAAQFNAHSVDIGQGCDLQHFLQPHYEVPGDLAGLQKPVIGYTGYISAWRIDAGIIRHIAEQLPHCSIVLVGPVDPLFDSEQLTKLKNVCFLGSKPPAELPAYISHFDICINPQVLNDITRGNYPRKADEYLAMGKPLVATSTEAMEMFGPYSFLCTSKEEYVEKIRQILFHPVLYDNEAEREKRRSFAVSHTWTESIGKLGDAYFSFKQNALH